jgi:hypothetical protein
MEEYERFEGVAIASACSRTLTLLVRSLRAVRYPSLAASSPFMNEGRLSDASIGAYGLRVLAAVPLLVREAAAEPASEEAR